MTLLRRHLGVGAVFREAGDLVHKISLGALIWFALLAMSATLVWYFDPGAPPSWPLYVRFAIAIFLAPGGLVWMALFWHPFGGGPTGFGQVFVALINATLWLLCIYISIWIFGRLRAPLAGRSDE